MDSNPWPGNNDHNFSWQVQYGINLPGLIWDKVKKYALSESTLQHLIIWPWINDWGDSL